MKNRIVYIFISRGLSAGVFESQVLGMAKASFPNFKRIYISQRNISIENILKGQGSEDSRGSIISMLHDKKLVEVIYFRSSLQFFLWLPILFISGLLNRSVVDFRALVSEESFFRNHSRARKACLAQIEVCALRFSSSLRCVSKNLKLELIKKFPRNDIRVVPCLVSTEEVVRKRKFVGRPDAIRLIYIGSLSKWQRFTEVCIAVRQLQETLDCSFTVVTKEVEIAKEEINVHGLVNIDVVSGDRQQVLQKLDESDFGFIFRDNSIVNTTASPIKFLEYVSRGVVPIVTGSIGDYTSSDTFKGGFIRYHGDPRQLAMDLKLTLCDPEILLFLNKLARAHTWEEYLQPVGS